MNSSPNTFVPEELIIKIPEVFPKAPTKEPARRRKTKEEEALLEEMLEEVVKEGPKEVEIDIPIPQKDPCCDKVCKDINEEVDARRALVGLTRTKVIRTTKGEYIEDVPPISIIEVPYPSTQHDLDAMENLRDRLRDEGVCNCATKKKVPREQVPKKVAPVRIPTTLSVRSTRTISPKKPIVPTHDSCCINVCKSINDEIRSIDDILNASIAQKGDIAMLQPKFEALAYQSFMLKTYRTDLKNKKICQCEE